MLWSYGAAVSAIAVNDNRSRFNSGPAKTKATSRVTMPDWQPIFTRSRTRYVPALAATAEKLTVARDPGSLVIRVSGTMPVGGAPRKLSIAVEEPAEYAAKLLARLLEIRGIKIGGRPRARHAVDPTLGGAQAAPRRFLWSTLRRLWPMILSSRIRKAKTCTRSCCCFSPRMKRPELPTTKML